MNKLLKTKEVAEILKITEAGMHYLRKRKAFPFYLIGNSYRYKSDDIQEFLEKKKYQQKIR